MDDELSVLRAVRLRLVARTDQVAVATGLTDDDAARLAALAGQGLVGDTPRGWRLSPDGQARLVERLDAERATVERPPPPSSTTASSVTTAPSRSS